MSFCAVSTFNADGLALYGDRMMETFCRSWPREVALRVYSEGWERDGRRCGIPDRLIIEDLAESSPWLPEFKERHSGRKFRNYRFDAVRFSHKVAALCAADGVTVADYLIWVDGDVVTHSPISLDDLAELAPKGDEWIAWLDRVRVYPECGFYIINRRHPRHCGMMAKFEGMYSEDRLFSLSEWHDSFVLWEVVKRAGVGAKSLSGAGDRTNHPLVNGPLSRWFDHAKGDRKKVGRTPKHERKIKDGAAYWQ